MRSIFLAATALSLFWAADADAQQGAVADGPAREAQCVLDETAPGLTTADALACLKNLEDRQAALIEAIAKLTPNEAARKLPLEDAKTLNSYAIDAFRTYVAAMVKVDENDAARAAAVQRANDLDRIAGSLNGQDRAALNVIAEEERAKAGSLFVERKDLADKADKALPPARRYATASRAYKPAGTELAQADPPRSDPDCANMVWKPDISLSIKSCKARALATLPGGDAQFPGSLLHPRGFSASVSGTNDGGTIGLTYAREFKWRSLVPDTEEGQRFWRWGFSAGISSGSGSLFNSDSDKGFFDRFDSKIALKGSIFVNRYRGQSLSKWNEDQKAIKAEAVKKCLDDQATAKPTFRSTCEGQQLTDWVYAPAAEGASLLHGDLASKVDALYFGAADAKPLWGGGIEGSISRPSIEFLTQDAFLLNFSGKFDDEFTDKAVESYRKIAWSITPYLYARVSGDESKHEIVLLGSLGLSRPYEYSKSTKEALYCPPKDTSVPFSTAGCKSYYPEAPDSVFTLTPAVEARFLKHGNGWLPPFAVSPKLSYALANETPKGDRDRWTLSLPLMFLVGDDLKTGLGIKFEREWGGTELKSGEIVLTPIDREHRVSLIFSKAFSLTGK